VLSVNPPLIQEIINAAIVFLVIMDPFSSMPVFISITRNFSAKQKARAANEAALVAAIPIIAFAVFGTVILSFMGVSLASFKVAGGLVLGILGLQLVLGTAHSEKKALDYKSAAVIVAVPLITGPAVITSTVLFTSQIGALPTLVAAAAALLAVWAALRASNYFSRLLGASGIAVASKLMGLLLVAIAVELIKSGLVG